MKGFQYLLLTAPPVAVLAARTLALWSPGPGFGRWRYRLKHLDRAARGGADRGQSGCAELAAHRVGRRHQRAGGVRRRARRAEAGEWIDANVPQGAQLMTIGPSMANILQYYGKRKAFALSVSTNPLNRNPSYKPIRNPDQDRATTSSNTSCGTRSRPSLEILLGGPAALCGPLQRPCRAHRVGDDHDGDRTHREETADRRLSGEALMRVGSLPRFVCLGASPAAATAQPSRSGHEPSTPIEHFIFLMQENHSFDNYFGTYPGRTGSRRTPACRSPRATALPAASLRPGGPAPRQARGRIRASTRGPHPASPA